MRGKHLANLSPYLGAGITPADAGKTVAIRIRKQIKRDHPRGCGENAAKVFQRLPYKGSPPRMRGKRSVYISPCSLPRITPADAGKTVHPSVFQYIVQDHPRGRGENRVYYDTHTCSMGSPPQVRGKQNHSPPMQLQVTDHPRRCGENVCRRNICMFFAGSPPQVRGKHHVNAPPSSGNRITPAGAGKTAELTGCSCPARDHPRRCGENKHLSRLLHCR